MAPPKKLRPVPGPTASTPEPEPTHDHVRIPNLNRQRSYNFANFDVDLRKQYVFSRGEDGHSEHIRVRVPPELHDFISPLIGKKSPFGYETFSAAVRDALVHHFGALVKLYGDENQQTAFGRLLHKLELAEQIEHDERQEAWVVQMRDRINNVVAGHASRNRLEDALERLQHYQKEVAALPDYGDGYSTAVMEHIADKVDEVERRLSES